MAETDGRKPIAAEDFGFRKRSENQFQKPSFIHLLLCEPHAIKKESNGTTLGKQLLLHTFAARYCLHRHIPHAEGSLMISFI